MRITKVTSTPVGPLPEVEVITGEEDEEEVFRQRGKLYRYRVDNGEWKERGIGDMKILKHKVNGTFRLLLRREQLHDVACNHFLIVDMKLRPMSTSETAWCWFAQDYSEGDAKMEQFTLRFKTKEIADEFRLKFEECQKVLSDQSNAVAGGHGSTAAPGEAGGTTSQDPPTAPTSATFTDSEFLACSTSAGK